MILTNLPNGLKKIQTDKRDFDHHKSFGTVGYNTATLPTDYSADAGLWTPDQNAMGGPLACTGFTQADLCADEDLTIYDPLDLYHNTPPHNDSEGRDIRDSLSTVCNVGVRKYLTNDPDGNRRTAYFNVKPSSLLDPFDAVRVAMYTSKDEHRSVSVGTPWFSIFNSPIAGIISAPPSYTWTSDVPGHNWKVCGWKTINGIPYLIAKPMVGASYGINGFSYFSREIFNNLLKIYGTGAFTVTKLTTGSVQTIDFTMIQAIVGFIRSLLNL